MNTGDLFPITKSVACVWILFVLAVAPGAWALTENFSVNPQWVGVGNTAGGNNYGYTNSTSFAGGAAGEVGGAFARVNAAESYYANVNIGSYSLSNMIATSGRFDVRNIVNWEASGDSGLFIGHLSSNTTDKAFIGLELKENDSASVRLRARFLLPGGSGGADSAFVGAPLNGDYFFSYTYDPNLGEKGRLSVTVSNSIGYNQTVSVDLSTGERNSGAIFNAFGMGMEPSMNSENDPGKHVDVFLDDVVYTRSDAPPEGFVLVNGADGGGVTNSFWMGQTEVTVSDYVQFLNAAETNQQVTVSNGEVQRSSTGELYCLTTAAANAYITYNASATLGQRFNAVTGRTGHPVIYVSWFGSAAFCNWKSTQAGRAAVYDPGNDWAANLTGTGYRLPTEAEWYKAAAWDAGLGTFKVYGTGANNLAPEDANYLNSGDQFETNVVRTATVGAYPEHSLYGLRDASGNVWEWCHDLYDAGDTDPAADAHALRGGGWGNLAAQVKTASRIDNKPDAARNSVGFRIVTSANPNL